MPVAGFRMLTIAAPRLHGILATLLLRPESLAVCRLLHVPRPDGDEYVAQEAVYHPYARLPGLADAEPRLVLGRASARLVRGGWRALRGEPLLVRDGPPGAVEIHLAVGLDDDGAGSLDLSRLSFAGVVVRDWSLWPLDRLRVAGAGMRDLSAGGDAAAEAPTDADGPWSRMAGALGGWAVWRRLAGLHFAVVGVGRTGSLMAEELAACGIDRLTLVDPDVLEPHNVDAMALVTAEDVGRPKVEALRERLAARFPRLVCCPVALPLHDSAAWDAATQADFVVTCPDENAPRLLAGEMCRRLSRPLLDVGTAVRERRGRRDAGADVRLILPGQGCLRCVGGVADADDAVRRLATAVQGDVEGRGPWQSRRLGSLRSLNQTAVGLGMRLIEDLAAGRLRESTWYRLTFSEEGTASLETRSGRREGCAFCGGGVGDGEADRLETRARPARR